MYKKLFENKKAVIFDLETILTNIDTVYIQSLKDLVESTYQSYIDVDNVVRISSGIEEICSRISQDPLAAAPHTKEELCKKEYELFALDLETNEEINIMEYFWTFIDEIKTTHNVKIILKSEFNEDITKRLMEKTDLTDVFDLVYIQTPLERKNLYKDILKQLKSEKIKPNECLTFEKYPERAQEAYLENVSVIVLSDPEKVEQSYPVYFIKRTDLSTFVNNIDKTPMEMFIEENSEEI